MAASPACGRHSCTGKINRPCPFSFTPENSVSRDRFSCPAPRHDPLIPLMTIWNTHTSTFHQDAKFATLQTCVDQSVHHKTLNYYTIYITLGINNKEPAFSGSNQPSVELSRARDVLVRRRKAQWSFLELRKGVSRGASNIELVHHPAAHVHDAPHRRPQSMYICIVITYS